MTPLATLRRFSARPSSRSIGSSPTHGSRRSRWLSARSRKTDNVLRQAEEQRRLEAETPGLLGLDVALEDEELQVEREQRFVTADETRGVVAEFLARAFPGAALTPVEGDDASVVHLHLQGATQREALRRLLHGLGHTDRTWPS